MVRRGLLSVDSISISEPRRVNKDRPALVAATMVVSRCGSHSLVLYRVNLPLRWTQSMTLLGLSRFTFLFFSSLSLSVSLAPLIFFCHRGKNWLGSSMDWRALHRLLSASGRIHSGSPHWHISPAGWPPQTSQPSTVGCADFVLFFLPPTEGQIPMAAV